MNYQHAYHAGSFTDVFKHVVLISLIKALHQKENAICYLDTHAGTGHYDLFADAAKKTQEFAQGIEKIYLEKNPPFLIKQYLSCVQQLNNRLTHSTISSLRYYPGSPAILHYFLRAQDRIVLSELHPQTFQVLKKRFFNDPQVSATAMDGYQSLKAFLPPKERRGLIFIDPAYERPNELAYLIENLPNALKRFATGVYAIWYPIKNYSIIERFHQAIKDRIQQPMLVAELTLYPEDSPLYLNGCGMLIINPPWKLDNQLQEILPWLWKTLSTRKQGRYKLLTL